MSDERISETTGPPRCPECHGRAAWTPFGPCKVCGRLPEVGPRLPPPPDCTVGRRPAAPRWVVFSGWVFTTALLLALLAPGCLRSFTGVRLNSLGSIDMPILVGGLIVAAFVTAFIRSAWEDHLNRSARD